MYRVYYDDLTGILQFTLKLHLNFKYYVQGIFENK